MLRSRDPGHRAGHRQHGAEPSRPVVLELLPMRLRHPTFAGWTGLPAGSPEPPNVAAYRRPINFQLARDSGSGAANEAVFRETPLDLDTSHIGLEPADSV